MIRALLGCLAAAAVVAQTAPGPAHPLAKDGADAVAPGAGDARHALLDGGSTIALLPLGSPTAPRNLRLYLEGFFRDEDAKGPPELPRKAAGTLDHLAEYKAAGASHLVLLYHDGADRAEYVRLLLLGPLTAEGMARLEAAGLGRRGAPGSFELVAYKDEVELPADATLPGLPIARLAAMATQLAAEGDCAIDIVNLARPDAAESYLEAVREAFAEEGQAPEKAQVPARAQQVPAAFPFLRSLGATHVVVTAFQNAKGADIVLVVAKGSFPPEALAKLRATYNPRQSDESSVALQRWVDGEEKGGTAAAVAAPEPHRKPFKK